MRIAIVRAIYGSTPDIITDVVRHLPCTASDETLRKTPVVAAVLQSCVVRVVYVKNRTVFRTLYFLTRKRYVCTFEI